jgi:hypothetical protein
MFSFYVFPAKNANPSKVVTLRAKGVSMQATRAYGTMVVLIHLRLNLALERGVLAALGRFNFGSRAPTSIFFNFGSRAPTSIF